MHIYIHIYIHMYIHTSCTHIMYTYICKYCMYVRTCIQYIHTHKCIHTYVRTYIHTYIHTYTHTYIHTYIRTYVRTRIYVLDTQYNTVIEQEIPRIGNFYTVTQCEAKVMMCGNNHWLLRQPGQINKNWSLERHSQTYRYSPDSRQTWCAILQEYSNINVQ